MQGIDFLENTIRDNVRYHKLAGDYGYDPLDLSKLLEPRYRLGLPRLDDFLYKAKKASTLYFTKNLYSKFERRRFNKSLNPYGLALFLQAYCKLYRYFREDYFRERAIEFAELSISNLIRTPNGLGLTNPKGFESSLSEKKIGDETVFLVGGSELIFGLLAIYEITKNGRYLEIAIEMTSSFRSDFHISRYKYGSCLGYSSSKDQSHVLNANALAAKALALVNNYSLETPKSFIEEIYSYLLPYCSTPNIPYTGSEDYPQDKAADSYHTGFFLRGMTHISSYLDDEVGRGLLKDRLDDYKSYFLSPKGEIRFLKDRDSVDIHGVAEYILVASENDYVLDNEILEIILNNIKLMQNDDTYYYQIFFGKKISCYMPRWGHAPMMNAIASLLLCLNDNE